MAEEAFAGWVLIEADAIPPTWAKRARKIALVPLLRGELESLSIQADPLDDRDRQVAELLVQGRPISGVANQLGITSRTVERRLTGLRRRYGVDSTAQLIAELARQGF